MSDIIYSIKLRDDEIRSKKEEIAYLKSKTNYLNQQISKKQDCLESVVKTVERILLNMEQDSPSYQYCYDLLFQEYEKLKHECEVKLGKL